MTTEEELEIIQHATECNYFTDEMVIFWRNNESVAIDLHKITPAILEQIRY